MTGRTQHESEAITGDDNVERYADAHEKHGKLLYRAFLNDVRKLRIGAKWLEVGAGPGILASILAEEYPDVSITAIDLSADMVAAARERINAKNLSDRINCRLCDANDKRELDKLGRFDFIYSTFSLHHWKNPIAAISNLWNLLVDGGVLYIHDVKRVWWARFLPLGKGDRDSIRAAYCPREIKGFLGELATGEYEIKTLFPFFLMSFIIRKQGNKNSGLPEGREVE
jgi:2-polyprenyl-3-methyl-5-hydroxy-6-metoxy-1,4-benzoquinol methylase